jgi:hypothetical protein
MDLVNIRHEIDKDLFTEKFCECCESRLSTHLYIIKTIMFGIFHICKECKDELSAQGSGMKSTFLLKKKEVLWEEEETPIR